MIKNNKGTREKRGKGEPGGYLHRSIIEKDTVTGWKRIVTKGTSNKDSHKVLPQVFQESDSNKETGLFRTWLISEPEMRFLRTLR